MNELLPREETLSITDALVRQVEAHIAPDRDRLLGAAKRLKESADKLIVSGPDDGRAILDDRKSVLDDLAIVIGAKAKTLHKCHRAVTAAASAIEAECDAAQRSVSAKLSAWKAEQDRIRREAEEAARREAERVERARREAEIAEAQRLAEFARKEREVAEARMRLEREAQQKATSELARLEAQRRAAEAELEAKRAEIERQRIEAEALQRIDAPLEVQTPILAPPPKVKNVRTTYEPVIMPGCEGSIPRQFCDVSMTKLRDWGKANGQRPLVVNGKTLVEFRPRETAF